LFIPFAIVVPPFRPWTSCGRLLHHLFLDQSLGIDADLRFVADQRQWLAWKVHASVL
jgi:hypothetical protein